MSNKKILAGIFVFFLSALGLFAFLVFFQKSGSGTKEQPIQVTTPTKKSAPIPEAPAIQPPPLATPKPLVKTTTLEESDPISDVLSDQNLDFTGVVTKLLETLPKLDADRQSEAAHHIANLSDDTTCNTWSRLVASDSLPAPVAEVLFNDMLNRPHELLMPFLGSIADQPTHPLFKDSSDVLEVLFGPPPQGTLWSAWIKNSQQE